MNRAQRGVVVAGLLLAILVGSCPPATYVTFGATGKAYSPAGRCFLLAPEGAFDGLFARLGAAPGQRYTGMAYCRLVVEWVLVGLLTGVVFFMVGRREE